jgi:hypothetical protein
MPSSVHRTPRRHSSDRVLAGRSERWFDITLVASWPCPASTGRRSVSGGYRRSTPPATPSASTSSRSGSRLRPFVDIWTPSRGPDWSGSCRLAGSWSRCAPPPTAHGWRPCQASRRSSPTGWSTPTARHDARPVTPHPGAGPARARRCRAPRRTPPQPAEAGSAIIGSR